VWRARLVVLSAVSLLAAACAAADGRDAATTVATTSTSTSSSAASTSTPLEPEITVPTGVLAAVPFQNRLDVAQGIFQLKLYNGTDRDFDIVAIQLVWDGMTTEVADRQNPLIAGDRLDYPIPLAPATCAGDGRVDAMPDTKHFARALYLQDCTRQRIEAAVDIHWDELREEQVDQRPVTAGVLRLTRREGNQPIRVLGVLNTINDTVFAGDGGTEITGDLPAGTAAVDIPVRFQEGRCDAHALSESSQPFKFVVQLDMGDGEVSTLAVVPTATDQPIMRERVERACDILGRIGFVGQDDLTPSTT
jgi:hypothetical protein